MESINNVSNTRTQGPKIPIQNNELESKTISFPSKQETTPSVVVGISQQVLNTVSSEIQPENQSNNQANKNNNQKEALQEKLTNAIREKNLNINLSFEVDDKGRNIVKFVDNATKEVIRQMPSEQALKIAESIDNFLEKYGRSFNTGLLVNDKA